MIPLHDQAIPGGFGAAVSAATPVADGRRRIVIVDGCPALRSTLSVLLQEVRGHAVVGAAGTVREGAAWLARERCDLVIFDWRLPDGHGLELAERRSGSAGCPRWLLLASDGPGFFPVEAVRAGVRAVVAKQHFTPARLDQAMAAAFAGEEYLCPASERLVRCAVADGGRRRLTARECEVLRWIAEGKRNAEIARILGTSASTVKTQVESIIDKLDVETRGAAVAAWREGMPASGCATCRFREPEKSAERRMGVLDISQ